MFRTKVVEEIKTHFTFSNFLFPPPENHAVCVIMWKKCCRVGQVTDDYNACTLHAGYLGLQIHTLRLCNTCFSTATLVVRMCRIVMFICTLPLLFSEIEM